MEQLTRDLHVDNILVSGNNAQENPENLRVLFRRLSEKGLCFNLEKCIFIQSSVEYLGHILSKDGVAKRSKVDTVLRMALPKDVGTLVSFMGSVQFYVKFLQPNPSTNYKLLHKFTM